MQKHKEIHTPLGIGMSQNMPENRFQNTDFRSQTIFRVSKHNTFFLSRKYLYLLLSKQVPHQFLVQYSFLLKSIKQRQPCDKTKNNAFCPNFPISDLSYYTSIRDHT